MYRRGFPGFFLPGWLCIERVKQLLWVKLFRVSREETLPRRGKDLVHGGNFEFAKLSYCESSEDCWGAWDSLERQNDSIDERYQRRGKKRIDQTWNSMERGSRLEVRIRGHQSNPKRAAWQLEGFEVKGWWGKCRSDQAVEIECAADAKWSFFQ